MVNLLMLIFVGLVILNHFVFLFIVTQPISVLLKFINPTLLAGLHPPILGLKNTVYTTAFIFTITANQGNYFHYQII
jgi:hypothetical protein